MAQINNFPGGFAAGVTIRGLPLAVTHPGKIFWVSNATTLSDRQVGGSNGNAGTFDAPFATVTYALSKCTASRGDVVMVKPGHAETISAAAGLILSKAGVAIVGLGHGSLRPTFTLGTANTASITVTANNVTVHNFLFKANFLNVATCFDIANAQVANDFCVDNCEFRDTSVILNFVACVKVGTTAQIADGLTLTNNKFLGISQTTEPAGRTFLVTASAIARLNVSDNFVVYPKLLADTATLIEAGALDLTQALIARNKAFRPNTSTTGGSLIGSSSTACSGIVCENQSWHLDASGLLIATGTKFGFFNNWSPIAGAADVQGALNPVMA